MVVLFRHHGRIGVLWGGCAQGNENFVRDDNCGKTGHLGAREVQREAERAI